MSRATRWFRRRRAVAAAAVTSLAAILLLVLAAGPAQAQGEPDPDLTSYVLFGFQELAFKGGQGNHGPSVIDGGNIGVNASGFIRGNDFRMNICANARLRMSNHTMVVSDTLRMGDRSTPTQECDVYEVFNNIAAPNNEQSRTGPAHAFEPPPIKATPPFPDFACDPANPFTAVNGQSVTMPPGNYGQVQFQNGSTVTLQAGTYTMCNFTTGQHVTVVNPPGGGVTIQSAQQFLINDDMHFDGPDCAGMPVVYVRGDGVSSNDNTVRFGQDSEIWGHFYAPTGQLNLGNQTDLHGTFWARSIASDFNVDVEYCRPPVPTPDTGSISVTKEIIGATAGHRPGSVFTIHFDCTIPAPGVRNALDGTFTLAAGETKTFTGVQVGTTCTAAEVDTPRPRPGFGYDDPVFVPSRTVTVTSAGQTVTLVVQNPLRRVFGNIAVTKQVRGETDRFVPGTTFGFRLDCVGTRFDTSFTLAPGETFTSGPIPVGVPCRVTETNVPDPEEGFAYDDPVLDPASGRVIIRREHQVVTVDATNRIIADAGRIRVRKDVTGERGGYVDGSEFGFSLDCDNDAFDTRFTLEDGEAFTSPALPTGTRCEVTETSVPDAADGFEWLDVAWQPDPPKVRVTEAGQVVVVLARNELARTSSETDSGEAAGGLVPAAADGSLPPLPGTGGPSLWLAGLGLTALVGGGVLVHWSRRARRRATRP